MVLNPNRKHYQAIKAHQDREFEDLMWCEDALFMERNSRNFKARAKIINANAEALCDYLIEHPKGIKKRKKRRGEHLIDKFYPFVHFFLFLS